ncbi:MAG TPA: methyl-accepting chemotaxis protein [bacterium]|nr:methyl-accepting chemotaxis protein [bacterium]
MSLRKRLIVIPVSLLLLFIVVMLAGILWTVQTLWNSDVQRIGTIQAGLVQRGLHLIEDQTLGIAALSAGVPGVQEAYALARAGHEDEGRTKLRGAIEPVRERLHASTPDVDYRIHYHLPPARSFLRTWRPPGKGDGGDDLSSFRATVVDANREDKVVTGIEVGRAGLVVRGIVPIRDELGQHLGTVEMLMPFKRVMEVAKADSVQTAFYLEQNALKTTDFVKRGDLLRVAGMARTYASKAEVTDPLVTADLLQRARKGPAIALHGGMLLTAVPILDYKGQRAGVLVYLHDLTAAYHNVVVIRWGLVLGSLVLFLSLLGVQYYLSASLVTTLSATSGRLADAGELATGAMEQVGHLGQNLASGAAQQATAVDQARVVMEDMDAHAVSTAQMTRELQRLADGSSQAAGNAKDMLDRLGHSMVEVAELSGETGRIVKSIDEIAFQTNLLALNAAVEAARAGDAGKSFSVVAEEVRNLAQRAAEAAQQTQGLLDQVRTGITRGADLTRDTQQEFASVAESVTSMTAGAADFARETEEQSRRAKEVSGTTQRLSQLAQEYAGIATDAESAIETLGVQVASVHDASRDLQRVVSGKSVARRPIATRRPAPRSPRPLRALEAPEAGGD